jgi:hypothetical protein
MTKKPDLFAKFALDYADHPKIVALSDAAFRAHVTFILYSRKYQTDGIIKNPVANRLALQWDTDVLSELQNNDDNAPSLQKLENGDYYITGYEEMQETRAEIEARRLRNAANGRKGGRPKGSKNKPKETQSVSESVSDSGTQNKAETETEIDIYTSDSANAEPRPDVERLLDQLDERVISNGHRKPNRTKKNINAARLLLDRDGYTEHQVAWMINWSTNHEFWRGNIRSMSKLREKFDELKAQATRDTGTVIAHASQEIDPDEILGPDYKMPPDPPEGLTMQQEMEFKQQWREQRKAERLEEARRKVNQQP